LVIIVSRRGVVPVPGIPWGSDYPVSAVSRRSVVSVIIIPGRSAISISVVSVISSWGSHVSVVASLLISSVMRVW